MIRHWTSVSLIQRVSPTDGNLIQARYQMLLIASFRGNRTDKFLTKTKPRLGVWQFGKWQAQFMEYKFLEIKIPGSLSHVSKHSRFNCWTEPLSQFTLPPMWDERRLKMEMISHVQHPLHSFWPGTVTTELPRKFTWVPVKSSNVLNLFSVINYIILTIFFLNPPPSTTTKHTCNKLYSMWNRCWN